MEQLGETKVSDVAGHVMVVVLHGKLSVRFPDTCRTASHSGQARRALARPPPRVQIGRLDYDEFPASSCLEGR